MEKMEMVSKQNRVEVYYDSMEVDGGEKRDMMLLAQNKGLGGLGRDAKGNLVIRGDKPVHHWQVAEVDDLIKAFQEFKNKYNREKAHED